jgi:hypothetical protein
VKYLWLQQAIAMGYLSIVKVLGEANVADVGTKHVTARQLQACAGRLGLGLTNRSGQMLGAALLLASPWGVRASDQPDEQYANIYMFLVTALVIGATIVFGIGCLAGVVTGKAAQRKPGVVTSSTQTDTPATSDEAVQANRLELGGGDIGWDSPPSVTTALGGQCYHTRLCPGLNQVPESRRQVWRACSYCFPDRCVSRRSAPPAETGGYRERRGAGDIRSGTTESSTTGHGS